jgi:AGCS family alanine or glycine:cation symporter
MLKFGTLAIVFFGSIVNAQLVWAVGDIGLGLIAWVNLACLVFLFPMVYRICRDYERQREQGLDPTFDPTALNIENADFWEKTEQPAARV